ncbi:ROK family protein, partial [mine drainage metagenome]
VGHMQVNPYGVACHCGSRGCWETEAGEGALVRSGGFARRWARRRGGGSAASQRWRPHMPCRGGDDGALDQRRSGQPGQLAQPRDADPGGDVRGHLRTGAAHSGRAVAGRCLRLRAARRWRWSGPKFGREAVLMGAAELALQVILLDPAVL